MKWIKPSGIEIETNNLEETLKYCVSLGWKDASAPKKEKPKPTKKAK